MNDENYVMLRVAELAVHLKRDTARRRFQCCVFTGYPPPTPHPPSGFWSGRRGGGVGAPQERPLRAGAALPAELRGPLHDPVRGWIRQPRHIASAHHSEWSECVKL